MDKMIHIAENIQTVHNSLSSEIPANSLSAKTTELVGEEDFEIASKDDKEDNFDDATMASIGELFATLPSGDEPKEDSKRLDILLGSVSQFISSTIK
jgi:hypothetical protein